MPPLPEEQPSLIREELGHRLQSIQDGEVEHVASIYEEDTNLL